MRVAVSLEDHEVNTEVNTAIASAGGKGKGKGKEAKWYVTT